MIEIKSPRLLLKRFQLADAEDVFACITPAVTKYMPWEPPSWDEFKSRCEAKLREPDPDMFSFVIRRHDNNECLGRASVEDTTASSPEVGLWLKETAHSQGFGKEAVKALIEWGHAFLGKTSFIYPVAVQNIASRRLAEALHGEIIGHKANPKYDAVIYKIPRNN